MHPTLAAEKMNGKGRRFLDCNECWIQILGDLHSMSAEDSEHSHNISQDIHSIDLYIFTLLSSCHVTRFPQDIHKICYYVQGPWFLGQMIFKKKTYTIYSIIQDVALLVVPPFDDLSQFYA